ncbi:aspartate dehydrogenase [Cytobacillus sp. Sa5YUA1]|uniref:L-aspartate dehydrogenase n=1 Tax=Cytobacillus stercorigallinarum TaxID=2762240 RepID=A0ABR8QM35_9BACI|nr:aspartate dehydrogenase [Cytobacillus stercorigallinarum]MBD7936586.1 aspartate dehydrogenase [Cytobacillus stercorigallinarum]
MKLGLIGGGNIGKFLLQSINNDQLVDGAQFVGLYTRNQEKANELAEQYDLRSYQTIDELIASDIDVIVEAATVEVVRTHAASILTHGKDLVVSSVGAFSDNDYFLQLETICKEHGTTIHLPSGAVGGLDILKAAKAIGALQEVALTTTKPPHALNGVSLEKKTVLFEGNAYEAIKQFPKNINVSIILSLAGLGSKETKVKIIADPKASKNSHEITAKGAFGNVKLVVENDPMPNNPKTSYLAALSVLSTLKHKDQSIKVG